MAAKRVCPICRTADLVRHCAESNRGSCSWFRCPKGCAGAIDLVRGRAITDGKLIDLRPAT